MRYGRERVTNEMKKAVKIIAIALLLALLLVLVPSPVSTFDAFAEVIELPIDNSTPGPEYNWDNYLSDTQYEDPTLKVDITWGGRIHDTNYVYAVIKVADASQLRTAMAYRYNSDYTAQGPTIAKANNAVFAINGDYFNYYDHGYLVRHTKLYRNRPNKLWDMLIIDQNGDFHTIMQPSKDKVAAWEKEHSDLTIMHTFNFGPVILLDGQPAYEDFDKTGNHDYIGAHKLCQRMAFAQLDELTYLAVTSEGPEDEGSAGMTMDQFAECLMEVDEKLTDYTIKVAYNLDGGSSSTMVFKEEKVNAPTNPKVRYLCDIIYFASAWQD